MSESVPDTVQLPECRLPVVLTAPEDETTTPQAVAGVVKKLTVKPPCPVVFSWLVNADEAVVVVVPDVGELWVRVDAAAGDTPIQREAMGPASMSSAVASTLDPQAGAGTE